MQLEHTPFPLVGIGASAGGLEAFMQLLHGLPVDTGMAYVFVQHMIPTEQSLLSMLLKRATAMPVDEAWDGLVVEANHVYVIAPNTYMTLEATGILRLVPRTSQDGQHLSINTFFSSLADVYREQAIGVLLSGMASDGTQGLQAIKARGGITFAQEASSAAYPAMPEHAIATGYVDVVLSPEGIARELARISRTFALPLHTVSQRQQADAAKSELEQHSLAFDDTFQLILKMLQQRTGIDFPLYKPTTMLRRIQRRMSLVQIEQIADYLSFLSANPIELAALSHDILIGVTSFFREPSLLHMLKQEVFPRLIEQKQVGEAIRVWVVGCSTGEEVYSLVISFQEYCTEQAIIAPPLQVFGTDLDSTAIEYARAGIYQLRQVQSVSPERLQRCFVNLNGSYRIHPSIRKCCVFAQHNILQDPPFSRIDLLSCQNVFIYFGPILQKRVLRTFHYALASHGFLLLGPSETVDMAPGLFTHVQKKLPLYSKLITTTRLPLDIAYSSIGDKGNEVHEESNTMYEKSNRKLDIQQEADHLLLARYAPASVLIDTQLEILQFRGHTSPYLEPASGKASLNLLKMAHEALRLELRTAVHLARKRGEAVKKAGIVLVASGITRHVTVEVLPLKLVAPDPYFVVLFEDTVPLSPASDEDIPPTPMMKQGEKDRRIEQLERELVTTREEMHSIIEEMEATNEELHAANEESLSGNEELRSLNEELETSKEEIQSSNEELHILNQELRQRNQELIEARDYARAIVETVRDPLLILDEELRIQTANPAFYAAFQLEPAQTEHRLLTELGNAQWNTAPVWVLLHEVLSRHQNLLDYETKYIFSTAGSKVMLLNARRIERGDSRKPLILLAIEDITERKLSEERQQQFVSLVENSGDFIGMADLSEHVFYLNEAGKHLVGLTEQHTILTTRLADYLPIENQPQFVTNTMPTVVEAGRWEGEVLFRHFQTDEAIEVQQNLFVIEHPRTKEPLCIATVVRDIRGRKELERQKETFINTASHELRTPITAVKGYLQLAQRRVDDLVRQKALMPPAVNTIAEELVKMLSRSLRQIDVQTRLIDDLLDSARIQTNKLNLSFAPCDLVPLVRMVVEDQLVISPTRTVEVAIREQETAFVLADQDRIGQVIENYLTNALKYAPAVFPITVGLTCTSEQVRVWVRDQGPGLSKTAQQHIWQSFYQVPDRVKQGERGLGGGGLGLGLSLCQALIHQHHGEVGVESAEGVGSTFWFTLPLLSTAL